MPDLEPRYFGPQQLTLRLWNPADHARLLWWVFFQPEKLTSYRARLGEEATKGIGTVLASTLLWIPLLIPMIALGTNAIPVQARMVPLWLLIAGIVVGWMLTVWLGMLEYPAVTGWRHAFGPVFEGAFLIVFGISFGIAFGMAFITGLDLMEVILVPQVFGVNGLIAMVAAFGVSFGVAYIIADQIAFGGAFIIAPMIAVCFTGLVAFGIGFVGSFFAIFLTTFGMAFVGAFVVTFLLTSLFVKRLERNPNSVLAKGIRIGGLAALLAAYGALVWICLLGGWRVLVG